jgi:REP-associated tyrosine transposase
MPRGLRRIFGEGDLHFITCSCYGRLPGFADPSHRAIFVHQLAQVRARYGFALFGYVVMPEHIHLVMSEPKIGTPSMVMQVLKQTTSRRLLKVLRDAQPGSTQHRFLVRLQIPSRARRPHFWQRRFYDFNVRSEKKCWQKLEYMHLNPVKRGLVKRPGDWPWSSFRFYAYGDTKMLAMDR